MAEEALLKFQADGLVASKVFIEANALLAWCLVHNTPNDASARARFVSGTGAGRIEPGR